MTGNSIGSGGVGGEKKFTKKTLNLLSMSSQHSRQFMLQKKQGSVGGSANDGMTSKERHAYFSMKIQQFEEVFLQVEEHFKNL